MRKGKIRQRVLIGLVTALLILTVAIRFLLRSPGTADFSLYRARYEALVVKIKTLGIAPGEFRHVWVNASIEPASLSLHRLNNDYMTGMVGVLHTESGAYQIAIVTKDMGHLGTFGYVYSDGTDKALSTPDLPSLERQINSHWWIAYNDQW